MDPFFTNQIETGVVLKLLEHVKASKEYLKRTENFRLKSIKRLERCKAWNGLAGSKLFWIEANGKLQPRVTQTIRSLRKRVTQLNGSCKELFCVSNAILEGSWLERVRQSMMFELSAPFFESRQIPWRCKVWRALVRMSFGLHESNCVQLSV